MKVCRSFNVVKEVTVGSKIRGKNSNNDIVTDICTFNKYFIFFTYFSYHFSDFV